MSRHITPGHTGTCPTCGGVATIVGDQVLQGGSLAYHEHQVVEDDGRRSWRPCAGRGTPARVLYLGGGQFRTQVGAL